MDSIRNFRGLGGIKTSLGTVQNKLFRGGPLDTISTQEQIIFAKDLNINQVLDLRSLDERTRTPNRLIDGVEYITTQLMPEAGDLSADPNNIMEKLQQQDFKGFMLPMYRSFSNTPFTLGAHKRFLERIAQNKQAGTYFHCSAGKDRTGFSSALLLKILGADHDTIMHDYLLTNNQRQEHFDQLLAQTRKEHGSQAISDEHLKPLIMVAPEYLEAAFDEINKTYGSFENYLYDGLKLSDRLIESLRQGLLE